MNVYENQQGDARQTTRAHLEASEVLFRPRYRQLTAEEVDLHDRIKTQAAVLAALFYEVEPIHAGPSKNRERGANVQLAIRNLEDAVYRAVKGLTGPVEIVRSEATGDRKGAEIDALTEKLGKGFMADAADYTESRKAEQALDGAGLAADVDAAERKTGIQDLPADQQKQLGEGKPIEPKPDPGAEPVDQVAPLAPRVGGPASVADAAHDVLVGSDAFDSHIQVGDQSLPLGEIVVSAFKRLGISADAWNNTLSQGLRDIAIEGEIKRRRDEAAGVTGAEEAATKNVARPVDADPPRGGNTTETAAVTNGPGGAEQSA